MELMDEAVLVHQQWELNRLAIESQPVAIHSAAVARGSRAALLMGASHSGKTTLAGWLAVHHEMEYLTDEVAVIDDEGRVIPFPRPLGVRSDSPLARLATERAPVDSSGHVAYERLVPAGVLGARVGTRPTPVGLLVFPTYRSLAESSVQQLDHADAFERIAALTPGLGTHGRIVFDRLCRMVEDARALAVTYGDVGDAARVVSDALDRSVDT
ncbi:MAG: hypothetical protein ABJH68_08130 [Ilumatobacter sp.]|uniref:hypothetical protein n=1 Tax=Ilumatobacter sp. TaxID=1967498 RepID=UPI0032967C2C